MKATVGHSSPKTAEVELFVTFVTKNLAQNQNTYVDKLEDTTESLRVWQQPTFTTS